MARSRSAAIALVLLACAAFVASSRIDTFEEYLVGARQSQPRTSLKSQVLSHLKKDVSRKEEPFFMSLRFRVSPSAKNDFIDNWKQFEDKALDDEGLNMMSLHKTYNDNIFFFQYSEWDSVKDLMRHLDSDHWEKFQDFIEDSGTTWNMEVLSKIEDQDTLSKNRKRKDVTSESFHELTYLEVQPEFQDEFVDLWRDVALDTIDEKANQVYSLHRVKETNYQFYVFGIWDSLDDYIDHYESKHIRKLRDFTNEQNILWIRQPLKMYSEPTTD
jgi:quinol monooxygenase YgiN